MTALTAEEKIPVFFSVAILAQAILAQAILAQVWLKGWLTGAL